MTRYVIWSFEHNGWWRPGGWGYTPLLAAAGVYSQDEAARIVARANVVRVNEQALTLADAVAFGAPAQEAEAKMTLIEIADELDAIASELPLAFHPPDRDQIDQAQIDRSLREYCLTLAEVAIRSQATRLRQLAGVVDDAAVERE